MGIFKRTLESIHVRCNSDSCHSTEKPGGGGTEEKSQSQKAQAV